MCTCYCTVNKLSILYLHVLGYMLLYNYMHVHVHAVYVYEQLLSGMGDCGQIIQCVCIAYKVLLYDYDVIMM